MSARGENNNIGCQSHDQLLDELRHLPVNECLQPQSRTAECAVQTDFAQHVMPTQYAEMLSPPLSASILERMAEHCRQMHVYMQQQMHFQ